MATQLQDYQKYDDFYQAFHQRRMQAPHAAQAVPQKPKVRRKVPWRFVVLTLLLSGLLLVLLGYIISNQKAWSSFKIQNFGQMLAGAQSKPLPPPLPSQEIKLCEEFLCQLPKSPWSKSMVVVDVFLKTDSPSHQRLDEKSKQLDRVIKDDIRATVAAADLYQVNDPKLESIRAGLESSLGRVFGEDMTGRILIPRWKVHY